MAVALARLRATGTAVVVSLYLLLVGSVALVHAWAVQRIDWLYRVGWAGAWLLLRLGGIRLEVGGRENLPRGQACLYMANHQSNVDPPVLFVVLPPQIAMMGKKAVFAIPVLGQALRLGGFVPIDRGDPEAARESVEQALAELRRGRTYLVFPEGTRSPDGQLQRFKHGVFLLAIRGGVPIVPITVDGGDLIMPKNKWELRPGTFRVTIHPPVATAGLNEGDRARLAEQVRAVIARALPPEKRGAPASQSDLAPTPALS